MADFWDDAKGVLGAVAPALATALGGPLAGQAVIAIGAALGLAPDTASEAVAQSVRNATTDQLLALKKADFDFNAKMVELGIELEKLHSGDRDSARRRDIAVRDATPRILALATTFFWIVAMGSLFFLGVPPENRELLARAMGTMDALLLMSYTFYFGSSVGSADKNAILARLTGTPTR